MVIGIVLMTVFNQFSTRQTAQNTIDYSQFMEEVRQDRISKVTIQADGALSKLSGLTLTTEVLGLKGTTTHTVTLNQIGDSIVMLADEMPPMPGMPEGGMARKSPTFADRPAPCENTLTSGVSSGRC